MRGSLKYPAGWTSKRLKYVATYNDEVLPESTDDLKEIDYVEISGVSLTGGLEDVNRMTFFEAPSRARRKVRSGDILVSTVRTYLRAIASVENASGDLIASTGFCVIRPRKEADSAFLGWVAKSEPFVSEVVARSVGVSYPAINASDLVNIKVPLPPLESQRQIARFLDEKTARIDKLIEKKRALLDGLAEKRQVFITLAVTKGLNPDAPMKPSGIDWLGEIPVHWEIAPMWTAILKLESGVSVNAMDVPAEIDQLGVLKTSAVYSGAFDPRENKTVYDDLEVERLACPVRRGEIIISRMNTPDLVGASGLVNDDHPNLYLPDRLWQTRFGPQSKAIPEFIYLFLNSRLFRAIIASLATGTSGSMQNISQDDLLKIKLALPPKPEQEKIASIVQAFMEETQKQCNKIMRSINLLNDLRAALITSAVTGN